MLTFNDYIVECKIKNNISISYNLIVDSLLRSRLSIFSDLDLASSAVASYHVRTSRAQLSVLFYRISVLLYMLILSVLRVNSRQNSVAPRAVDWF